MKVTILSISFLILALSSTVVGGKPQFVEGEILIKFKSSSQKEGLAASLALRNHTLLKMLSVPGLVHAQLSSGESVSSAITRYYNDPTVEYAQPNFIYHTTAIPNDPSYSQQWSLKNTGQTILTTGGVGVIKPTNNPGTAGMDMGLEAAWDLVTDCSAVTVAVVDTGVNYNHKEFIGNLWDGGATYPNHGYDFVLNTNAPMDLNGHGTHVAGTIAAAANDGIGTTGVCWKSKLMVVRALDTTGTGTTVNVVQGVTFAVNHGAKVINISIGGGGYDTAFYNELSAANTAGVAVVIAAGNETANNDSGSSPTYPCNYDLENILCVAALDQSYALASFSNYGSTSVDMAAPGVNVISSYAGTVVSTKDPLTAGWTFVNPGTSPWGYKLISSGASTFHALVNPTTINFVNANYSSNADNTIFKSFDLSAASDATTVSFQIYHDLGTGDSAKLWTNTLGVNPTGVTLSHTYTGHDNFVDTRDLSLCKTATCSIGFQLVSDASNNGLGLAVIGLSLDLLTLNTTTYDVLGGTSMASPNAAGVVALALSYNPSFTASDALAAVRGGGTPVAALNGKTVTGKAVNAMGALAFINAPTGVTVVKK